MGFYFASIVPQIARSSRKWYGYCMRKRLINKIAEEMSQLAIDLGLLMAEIAFTPYGQLRLNRISRTTYYRKLQKFERHGLIKRTKTSQGYVYRLTQRAKRLRRNPAHKDNREDGLSTIIMFDIPEEKHQARDNIRRYLIRNGYTQIQKSVFISPFKISSELKDFSQELGIKSNMIFISGSIDHR